MKFLRLATLLPLLTPVFAASLTVDTDQYLIGIGTPTTMGGRGTFLLNPTGVLGYANYGGAAFTPTHRGGPLNLELSSIGTYTLQNLTGLRYYDSVSGIVDGDSVRGASAIDTGYRFSFIPGSPGDYSLSIHLADSKANIGYAVTQDSNPVGTPGTLPNSGSSLYDEGIVTFNIHVTDEAEAASTWNFDITHKSAVSGAAIAIGGAWIMPTNPVDPPVQVGGLGLILCIGDSITEGKATRPTGDGNWSWRYWCWQNFIDFKIDHEFVGTRTANNGGTSLYPLYSDASFSNRHEAIWGTTFSERASSAPTYLSNLKASGKTPNTAIIFGGGNDVALDLSLSATTVRDRTKAIIDHLQGDLGASGNPNIRVLLVSILPRFTNSGTDPDVRNPRYAEINALLAEMAISESTATSKVEYVDLYQLFNNPTDALLYDGTHPGGTGEQLIGNAIFAALVPNMEPVSIKFDSFDSDNRTVKFLIRTHGPRQVGIEASTDLDASSWLPVVPPSLNPGEWIPATYTHSASLPTRWFFRAKAP